MKTAVFLILFAFVFALFYVRLSPTNVDDWHVAPQALEVGDYPQMGGFTAVREAGAVSLLDVERVALATPRTKRIAGSVEEGRITYVTRSLLWGFPDYTTVSLKDGKLTIEARLRFGRSDLGVNGKRVRAWLSEMGL